MPNVNGPRKEAALKLLAGSLERDLAARDNVVLGLYSEALVALALGGELASNRWESWDVEAADGGRIQVKTSTAMAIGKPDSGVPSVPRWSGFKPGYRWIVETNAFESDALWHADYWALARIEGLDPFDDDNWSFFLLTREQVRQLGAQSAGAAGLVSLGYRSVRLDELRDEYERLSLDPPMG